MKGCISTSTNPIFKNGELICQHGPHSVFANRSDPAVVQVKEFSEDQKQFLLKRKLRKGKGTIYSDEPEREWFFRFGELCSDPFSLKLPGKREKGQNNYSDNAENPELDHIRDRKKHNGCNSFRNASYISSGLNNGKRNSFLEDPKDPTKVKALFKDMEKKALKNKLYRGMLKDAKSNGLTNLTNVLRQIAM